MFSVRNHSDNAPLTVQLDVTPIPDGSPGASASYRVSAGTPSSSKVETRNSHPGVERDMVELRALAAEAGASVRVEEVSGHAIVVTMPVSREGETVSKGSHVRSDDRNDRGMGVLVIEKEPMLRAMIVTVIGDAGFEVLGAADGAEAVDLAGQFGDRIGVVIVDTDSPESMNEADMARLRVSDPSMQWIVMRGVPNTSEHDVMVPGLPCCVLRKPFDMNELVQEVEAAALQRGRSDEHGRQNISSVGG